MTDSIPPKAPESERAHNYERPGSGWHWNVSARCWEKGAERRYPIVYAESEG